MPDDPLPILTHVRESCDALGEVITLVTPGVAFTVGEGEKERVTVGERNEKGQCGSVELASV